MIPSLSRYSSDKKPHYSTVVVPMRELAWFRAQLRPEIDSCSITRLTEGSRPAVNTVSVRRSARRRYTTPHYSAWSRKRMNT